MVKEYKMEKEYITPCKEFNIGIDKVAQVATDGTEDNTYYLYNIWNEDMTELITNSNETGAIGYTYQEAFEDAVEYCNSH
jgi:hypothetical protein